MAIIQNTETFSLGSYSWKNEAGKKGTVSQQAAKDILLRVGTGRRRKPSVPDQTAYERSEMHLRTPRGNGRWSTNYGQWQEWTGILPKFASSDLPAALQNPNRTFDSNIADVANLKALQKFNQRDLDLGTAWAERSKAIQLVRGVATTAVEAMNDIRRKDGRGLLNTLGLDHAGARARGVVDANLTYHYGMKPLLQDVAGATQALARATPQQWKILSKGSYADESKTDRLIGLGSFYPYHARSRLRKSCRTIISAVQRPLTREQDLLWALGLDNPLGTAWEVTPYSFVADWLIPIGDWLGALNSIKYYSGWETVSSSYFEEEMIPASASGTLYSASIVNCDTTIGGGFYRALGVKRTIVNNLPMLGLPVKDPRSVDHLSKVLSLLASHAANGGLPPIIRY